MVKKQPRIRLAIVKWIRSYVLVSSFPQTDCFINRCAEKVVFTGGIYGEARIQSVGKESVLATLLFLSDPFHTIESSLVARERLTHRERSNLQKETRCQYDYDAEMFDHYIRTERDAVGDPVDQTWAVLPVERMRTAIASGTDVINADLDIRRCAGH